MSIFTLGSAGVNMQQHQKDQKDNFIKNTANQKSEAPQKKLIFQKQPQQKVLNELLEAIKQEFDIVLNEISNFKHVKDVYELKCNQHTSELQQIRQAVYELEMTHRKTKEAYEDEIIKLKMELDNKEIQNQIHQQPESLIQNTPNISNQNKTTKIDNKLTFENYQMINHDKHKENTKNQSLPHISKSFILQDQKFNTVNHVITKQESTPDLQCKKDSININLFKKFNNFYPFPDQTKGLAPVDKNTLPSAENKMASHLKEIPEFLMKNERSIVQLNNKKQKSDYHVLYNPDVNMDMNIELIHTLEHLSVVCCVCFSKDGSLIATGCNELTQVFNVETGELLAKLIDNSYDETLQDDISNFRNNVINFTNEENKNSETNDSKKNLINSIKNDLYIRSVCFSPDGLFLATGAEDSLIKIWNLSTKKIFKVLKGHKQDVYSLEFFSDSNRLVSGSGDGTVRIWDLKTSKCTSLLVITEGVTSVSISSDDKYIVSASLDRSIRIWNSETGTLVDKSDFTDKNNNGHKDSIYSVIFTNDNKQIISGSLDKTIKLWNLDLAIDDSKTSFTDNNMISNIDNTNSKSSCLITYVGHKDFVLSVCSTPDNEMLLSGSKDRGVMFWNQSTGVPLLMLQGHLNSVISVAVSPNFKKNNGIFVTGSGDCKAKIWKCSKLN